MNLWFIRLLNKKLTQKEAEGLGLIWFQNIYGDAIDVFDCRSIWCDSEGRPYRVKELNNAPGERALHIREILK